MEKSRNLPFHFVEQPRIVLINGPHFTHPIAGFPLVDDNGIVLVVGTQYELGEKLDLQPIFAFGFQFERPGRTECLEPFGILPAVQ